MPKLIIDGIDVDVEDGTNLLQACEAVGAEIPRFCYHESLSVAGNCRMCLVQVEKSPKPVASCATQAMDGMVVHTKNEYVRKAREGVMEFLLINHPLDCPICDQGGECDLQDQAYNYGVDFSRFHKNKRAVEDKYIGPLVKTIMTRCIHCTRCVRFSAEVAGVGELGATGRGEDMEITTYLEQSMDSELSGNVIDLCPVGALTSYSYQFKGRSWELQKTETYDVMDAMGLPIRVDSRGREILRILPRENENFEDSWISDKTRFVCDAFKKNRLDTPYIRKNKDMMEDDYYNVLDVVAKKMSGDPKKIAILVGDLAALEDIYVLKKIADYQNIKNRDCRTSLSVLDPRLQGKAVSRFNTGFENIYQADCVLFIGGNMRLSAPVLNSIFRKHYFHNHVDIALIGEAVDLTYPYTYLGNNADVLNDFVSQKHRFFKKMKKAKHPMIVLDEQVCVGNQGRVILANAIKIAVACGAITLDNTDSWQGFNMVVSDIALNGALEVSFLPDEETMGTHEILKACKEGQLDTVFLLGYDNPHFECHNDVFVIYQGSHAGVVAQRADCILPAASYVEKSATYINMEGQTLKSQRATFPLGQAREDWAIMRALAEKMSIDLNFNTLEELQEEIENTHPDVKERVDMSSLVEWANQYDSNISSGVLPSYDKDFYLSNVIAQNSDTMQECSRLKHERIKNHKTKKQVKDVV